MRSNGLKARLLADLAAVTGLLFLSPALAFSQTPFYQGKIDHPSSIYSGR